MKTRQAQHCGIQEDCFSTVNGMVERCPITKEECCSRGVRGTYVCKIDEDLVAARRLVKRLEGWIAKREMMRGVGINKGIAERRKRLGKSVE